MHRHEGQGAFTDKGGRAHELTEWERRVGVRHEDVRAEPGSYQGGKKACVQPRSLLFASCSDVVRFRSLVARILLGSARMLLASARIEF